MSTRASEHQLMQRAIAAAAGARSRTSPNPWVGVCHRDAGRATPSKAPPNRRGVPTPRSSRCERPAHAAERGDALLDPRALLAPRPHAARAPTRSSRPAWRGSSSASRTPTRTSPGAGIARLRAAGIEVESAWCADEVRAQLAPYLKHRRTGRPYVVLKLAATLDGRTAAPDGTSQWITGTGGPRSTPTGCGPRATPSSSAPAPCAPTIPRSPSADVEGRDPLRVVLGQRAGGRQGAPGARARRATSTACSTSSGAEGVVQAHGRGRRDRGRAPSTAPAWSIATCCTSRPALFGGDDARPLFAGPGAPTIDDVWRGRIVVGRPPRRRPAPRSRAAYGRPDVHRHRRGARHRASVAATARRLAIDAAHRARRRRASATRSRSTAAASPWSSSATAGGRPTRSTETLDRTNLGDLARRRPREPRAAGAPADRLGGHLVQGHVDGVGDARRARRSPTARRVRVRRARRVLRYVVREGLDHRRRHQPHRRRRRTTTAFAVAVIPHTLAVTTLGAQAARATASTSRSTSSPSTSSGCSSRSSQTRRSLTMTFDRRSSDAIDADRSAASSSSSSTTRTARTRATSSWRPRRSRPRRWRS